MDSITANDFVLIVLYTIYCWTHLCLDGMVNFCILFVLASALHHIDQKSTTFQIDQFVKWLCGHTSLLLYATRYIALGVSHYSEFSSKSNLVNHIILKRVISINVCIIFTSNFNEIFIVHSYADTIHTKLKYYKPWATFAKWPNSLHIEIYCSILMHIDASTDTRCKNLYPTYLKVSRCCCLFGRRCFIDQTIC